MAKSSRLGWIAMEEKFPLEGLVLNVVHRVFSFLVPKSCVLFENKQAHVDSFLLVEGLVSLLD